MQPGDQRIDVDKPAAPAPPAAHARRAACWCIPARWRRYPDGARPACGRRPGCPRAASADIHVLLLAQDQHAEELLARPRCRRTACPPARRPPPDARGVSDCADTVMMPTRFPGGSVACTHGTWISALVATGTRTCAASSRWNSDRKPQLVVIASAPSTTSSAAAARKSSQQPGRPVQHHALRAGAAHHAVQHRERPGRGVAHVAGNAGKPSPPASGCRAARRRSPCRRWRCLVMRSVNAVHAATLPETARARESGPRSARQETTPWPTGPSTRPTSTCWPSGTPPPSATAWRSPTRSAARFGYHRRADGLHRPEGQADRRPGAGRHDPLHRTAARQGHRPGGLVRLRRTPPTSPPSR